MRVLWVTKGLGPGGAERLLASFAGRIDRSQFAVSAAYLLPAKAHLVPALERVGVDVTCLNGARTWDLRWLGRLRRLVVERDIDVVHLHSPLVAALARPVLRFTRRPPALVSTEHNMWRSYHWVTRELDRLTLPLEAATLTVSDEVRNALPPRLAARTETLVHGVDVDGIAQRRSERASARASLGVADDELLVGTVANLRADKDYPTLLAAARISADRGSPIRFVSVGQGQLADELEEQRAALGLGDRFRFLGYREDPIGVLAACDVFSLCSLHEGLSIALLEALALGIPAVVTPVGGVSSVVRDGVEAIYVPARAPEEAADAFERLLDPSVREPMGLRAASRAADFNIDRAVARQQALYIELASRRRDRVASPRA